MMKSLTYNDVTVTSRVLSEVASRSLVNTEVKIKRVTLSLPIIPAPMDTVCNGDMAIALDKFGLMGLIHRFQSIESQIYELNKVMATKPKAVGCAVGVSGDYQKRLKAIMDIYIQHPEVATAICFDTANGHSLIMQDALHNYFDNYYYPFNIVIAGNVASKEGYIFLQDLGVDIVRLGIGSGSACTTSQMTGIGQGIMSILRECRDHKKTALLMADGGIKSSGDIVKALAYGADLGMVGSFFAGFDESPGEIIKPTDDPKSWYKYFRGMASISASKKINEINEADKAFIPEGVEHRVPYKESILDFLPQIKGWIQSGLSYCNSLDLETFKKGRDHLYSVDTQSQSSQVERTPFIQENGV